MMPPPGVPLPPGIVPPPAAPVAPAAPKETTPADPKESTTVYVGKIPPSVDDDLVRILLDACGDVRSWKRVMDPENNTPKRFGFCEFVDAEGVLRAMRILDGFPVAGEELLLNVNQATKAYVEHYTATRTVQAEEDAEVDGTRREMLQRAVASAGKSAEAVAFLSDALGGNGGNASTAAPPPPPPGGNSAATLGGFVAARDADSALPPPPPGGQHGGVEAPRQREPSMKERREEERRERQRREEERRAREERARVDREYRDRERRIERAEADRQRDARRERERARDVEHDRRRDVEDDLKPEPEEIDAETSLGPNASTPDILDAILTAGPPRWFRDEKGRDRRRRYRERERENDERDAALEEEEKIRKAAEAAKAAAEAAKAAEEAAEAAQEAETRERAEAEEAAAAAEDAKARGDQPGSPEGSPEVAKTAPLFAKKTGKKQPAGGKRKLSVFAVEDEEQKPTKALVPIEYTAEELAAAAAPATTMAEDDEDDPAAAAAAAAKRAAAVIAKKNQADKDEKARGSLIESIPTEKKKLFKYEVDWSTYDASNLSESVQRWVSKKVAELLGEEEPSLVEFVVEKVGEHLSAKDMVGELEPVLDNEAEPFVIKLWRMLIYETLKANEKA